MFTKQSAPFFILLFLVAIATSCSKKSDATPEPEPEPIPHTEPVPFNKIVTVFNFGGEMPDGSKPLDDQAPIYFSLENKIGIPPSYQKTNRWDISLSSIYRSFIGGNNGTLRSGSHGEGGPGKGGVVCLTQNFDDVIDIPDDKLFKTGGAVTGTDDSGAYGEGIGYYLYDFGGTIKGDGSFDSKHVAYALPDIRTVVVRTAKGNYAKIQVLSLYKDLLDPKTWKQKAPHTFLTFRYVLAKAGSKKFTIDQ